MIQARNTSNILTRLLGRFHISRLVIGTFSLIFVLLLAACATSMGTTLIPFTTSASTTHVASTSPADRHFGAWSKREQLPDQGILLEVPRLAKQFRRRVPG